MANRRRRDNPLYDPGTILTGEDLYGAARAAARVAYNPTISAHKASLAQIARGRKRDDRGLAKLGRKTVRGIGQDHSALDRVMAQGVQTARAAGGELVSDVARDSREATTAANKLQSGLMGDQLASLQGINMEAGGSESQAALAAAVAQAQGRQGDQSEALAGLAKFSAAGMTDTARNLRRAERAGGVEAKNAVRSAVASRRMDSRGAYRDAEAEVRASLRNARSLKGAEILNNIMRLRDSERTFANERAALMLDARTEAQKNKVDWYNAKNDDKDGGSGGSGGSDDPLEPEDRPNKLAPFWKDWLHAANQVRGAKGRIGPGRWQQFLDKVEEDKEIDWSPTQRAKFLKRYVKWYQNNVLG